MTGKSIAFVLDEHKLENAKIFKRYAPFYDLVEFVVGNVREELGRKIPPHSSVLDVACGTGTHAVSLAKQGHNVVGIDLSEDMLAKARKKGQSLSNVSFEEKDASNTGYPDDSFDVSIVSFGLHDMPEMISVAVLGEMKRVTKPGGYMYILDYGQPTNKLLRTSINRICGTWETDHYHEFIARGVEYYLKRSGITNGSHQTFLWGVIKLTAIKVTNEWFDHAHHEERTYSSKNRLPYGVCF